MKEAILLLRDRSFFGANIVNLPAIYLTKKYLQTDQVFLFTDINVRYFYEQIPWVSQQSDARHFYQIYRGIRPKADFLYSMRPSMDSAPFLKYTNGIKTAIGFSLRSALLNRLFDYHCPYSTSTYRAVSHIQPLLNYLHLTAEPLHYLREAMLDLIKTPRPQNSNSICIMPGAGGGEHKKWGIENYWQLMELLHTHNPNLYFHFIMGSDEKEEMAFLQSKEKTLPFSIHQNLALTELIALVESSALTIANDCGPSHISQCLVKPFIGLYYEPNIEWFLPHTLSRSLCPTDKNIKNIKNIAVDEVFTTSLQLLNAH